MRVEYITFLQGVARLNQNELELVGSVSQMRYGKNSTARHTIGHIDSTFQEGE